VYRIAVTPDPASVAERATLTGDEYQPSEHVPSLQAIDETGVR
jgi:hypothetical protein